MALKRGKPAESRLSKLQKKIKSLESNVDWQIDRCLQSINTLEKLCLEMEEFDLKYKDIIRKRWRLKVDKSNTEKELIQIFTDLHMVRNNLSLNQQATVSELLKRYSQE